MSRVKHNQFSGEMQDRAKNADTQKQGPTKYLSSTIKKDVSMRLANYHINVDLKQLAEEVSQMPIESFSSELINNIKIVLRGYQVSPEFDQFYKSKFSIEDKIALLNIINNEIATKEQSGENR